MFQNITIEQLLEMKQKGNVMLIDVRSPAEFAEFSIPGSLNIPLFDDAERTEIGTLYKQASVQSAKDKGLEIVAAKLPAFVKSFEKIAGRKIVYCWRGGMRSHTTATVLALMDIHVSRLEGGIRAYRKWVVDMLERFVFRPQAVVIHGYTGSGKTYIVRQLMAQGHPALDLEEMAGHRGSVFGHIGLRSNNQKTFDSLLLEGLLRYEDSPFILFEAESKRIGKAVMPVFLADAIEQGTQFLVEMPLAERVRQIIDDYMPNEHKTACLQSFYRIKGRIHIPVAAEIEAHLLANRFAEAVHLLLLHYYDPRYKNTIRQNGQELIMIRCQNADEAVEKIASHLKQTRE